MALQKSSLVAKNLSEKGARLCPRPAAARGKLLNAPRIRCLLRLVEDDTAALRDFQTRFQNFRICFSTTDERMNTDFQISALLSAPCLLSSFLTHHGAAPCAGSTCCHRCF
jgi:hypothetical protein